MSHVEHLKNTFLILIHIRTWGRRCWVSSYNPGSLRVASDDKCGSHPEYAGKAHECELSLVGGSMYAQLFALSHLRSSVKCIFLDYSTRLLDHTVA